MARKESTGLTVGTLSLVANSRIYSKKKCEGQLNTLQWEEELLPVQVLSKNQMNQRSSWALLALYHCSHFYEAPLPPPHTGDNITSKSLARAMVGLLCLLTDPIKIKEDTDLRKGLRAAGIRLEYRAMTLINPETFQSHHFIHLKNQIEPSGLFKELQFEPEGVVVLMGVIILSLVKSLNSTNGERWIFNRIKTFSGSVGSPSWIEKWEGNYPTIGYLAKLNSFMSSNFALRRAIFIILNSIASNSDGSVITTVCQDIIQMMRGTEMHHLVLIDTYLIRRYPELLSLHCLRDTLDQYQRVINRLKKENQEDVLFMRLLYSKEETSSFNRQNFKMAAIVATTCARWETPSFDYYYMDTSDRAQELSNWVLQYLQHRQQLASIAIGESPDILMGPREEAKYFESVMEDYIRKRGQPDTEVLSGPVALRAGRTIARST